MTNTLRPESLLRRKQSAYQRRLLSMLIEGAQVRTAIDNGQGVLLPPAGVKQSGAKVVISSPLEKRANYTAVVREAMGKQPYAVPGVGDDGILTNAWKNRPEMLGGKPRWQRTAEKLRDLLMKDEMVVNASGVPIGRKRTFMPGMPGKLMRIPLALGGLAALNAGVQSFQEGRRERGSDARFENALNTLRSDEGFSENYASLVDPNTEEGAATLPSIRRGFDILDNYAPDVTDDPTMAANFLESIVAGKDQYGVAMSPHEYGQHVEQAVSLQNSIRKQKDRTIFDNVGNMLGRLIDPS